MPPTTTLDLPCGLPIQSTRDRQFYDRECAKRCCMKKPAEPTGATAGSTGCSTSGCAVVLPHNCESHYTALGPRVNSRTATPRARPTATPATAEAGSSQATAGSGRRRSIPRWYGTQSSLGKPNWTRSIGIREVNSSLVFPSQTRLGERKPSGGRENLVTQV